MNNDLSQKSEEDSFRFYFGGERHKYCQVWETGRVNPKKESLEDKRTQVVFVFHDVVMERAWWAARASWHKW